MTNWKTYTITEIKTDSSFRNCKKVFFSLDDDVKYSDGEYGERGRWIFFEDYFDYFKSVAWQVGDVVEINLDKTKYYSCLSFFELREKENINNLMRKVSSSSEITRGQAIADRLIREVNSQPPGKVEFEHRIEHRDSSPERLIYRRNY